MPTKIDFRDCVHQGVAGPTPDHILASIHAEYCMPRASLPALRDGKPAVALGMQLEDFAALARALGHEAFRQLVGDVLRQRDPGSTLAQLPDFLTRHRYGRATPALIDLARLERAVAECERAPDIQSVGLCCLPPELVRTHPDLTLSLHPAWRWLHRKRQVALLCGVGSCRRIAGSPVWRLSCTMQQSTHTASKSVLSCYRFMR